MKFILLTFAMVLALGKMQPVSAQDYLAKAPPLGVYGCFGQNFISMPSYALIDAKSYIDNDGKPGAYVYDTKTGILSMTSGSHQGFRYKRNSEKSFRKLNEQGEMTSCSCVWEPKKDPNKRPW